MSFKPSYAAHLSTPFSAKTRAHALKRFQEETFDLLVVGGGITGAAVARDAALRGLKVALVEKRDFAFGTSSRSSKLIHGGLRYLEKMEFSLVFEALRERALLLKTLPTLVRPLKFYFPVYTGFRPGKTLLGMGMWLYDLLALFRAPGFHKSLSKKMMLQEIPGLRAEGLKGGYSYFDASMWDDVLAVEILRSAQLEGAAVANYIEAVEPIWKESGKGARRIAGYKVRDREPEALGGSQAAEISLKAKQVVLCLGPYTDLMGPKLNREWKARLAPSKGVHLVFDATRLPVPGAVVMSHPEDGRISFVIPRPDYGAGVVIVGTTDGPATPDPDKVDVAPEDTEYLLGLLNRYFPEAKLTNSDILSAYVGVRPLVAPGGGAGSDSESLQKVSREHHIEEGPGGVIWVAGGKYTTHRTMAAEIVDIALERWEAASQRGEVEALPISLKTAASHEAPSVQLSPAAILEAREEAAKAGIQIPEQIWERFGGDALEVARIHSSYPRSVGLSDPAGFPWIEAQFRFQLRHGMVMHLADFIFRRSALYMSRADHGLPWVQPLSKIWAEERGLGAEAAVRECSRTEAQIVERVKGMGYHPKR
jgi:glycerol-3-phosphate dehydrogenase